MTTPRLGALDSRLHQELARQVESADRGILVEVAQDVGELQCTPEVVRQLAAGRLVHAEDTGREAADGDGDAVAIEAERRGIGRANVRGDVHFHAVDHVEEIRLFQAECPHRCLEEARLASRPAAVERIEVLAPFGQRCGAGRARPRAVVGDIVDQAAEDVDREHRLALDLRHEAHGGVERAAGNACPVLADIGRGGGHRRLPCRRG